MYKNEYSAELGKEQNTSNQDRIGNRPAMEEVVRTSKEYMVLVNKPSMVLKMWLIMRN